MLKKKTYEKILVIKIFQPFAQYRNPFTFYYAQTYPLPPKSTVIGMLQNVVGDWYGNTYGIENWWDLKVSIHGGFESIFWNYQQFIKGKLSFTNGGVWINRHKDNISTKVGDWMPVYGNLKSQRSPIYQQELFNGHFYIFVKGFTKEQLKLLDRIKTSLDNPEKILYLGRSEDVIFIKNVEFVEKKKKDVSWEDVDEDLVLTLPTYLRRRINKNGEKIELPIANQKYPVYSIPIFVGFKSRSYYVKHKSEITKQTQRDVRFEDVIYAGSEFHLEFKIDEKKHVEGIEIYQIDDKKIKEIRIVKEFGWL